MGGSLGSWGGGGAGFGGKRVGGGCWEGGGVGGEGDGGGERAVRGVGEGKRGEGVSEGFGERERSRKGGR